MDEVTQVLFGMNGFQVLSAVVDPLDGELRVVETIDPDRGCPDWGVVGYIKQRPVVCVRDATFGESAEWVGRSGAGRAGSRRASGGVGLNSTMRSALAAERHDAAGSRWPRA